MLDIIIDYHKRILNNMIENNASYEEILKESQFLDKYIIRKMNKILI